MPAQGWIDRRSFTAAAAASLLPLRASRAAAPPIVLRQSQTLAAADFIAADGTGHRLSELRRPLILVNLWAHWCEGCLAELPGLQQMISQVGADRIDVVLLSHDMNWRDDLVYARRAGLPYRLWCLSPRTSQPSVAAAFRIENDRFGLPQALVFAGGTRRLLYYSEGSQDWAAPEQIARFGGWLSATD